MTQIAQIADWCAGVAKAFSSFFLSLGAKNCKPELGCYTEAATEKHTSPKHGIH